MSRPQPQARLPARVAALVWLVLALAGAGAAAGGEVPLDGAWKIHAGHDPAWADPAFDDSGWRDIVVPGTWARAGFDPPTREAWYRRRFTLPEDFAAGSPGLALGNINERDEVFLDGRRLGGSGGFHEHEWSVPLLERVYAVPPGLLRPGGTHVLAVRVGGDSSNAGIADGPVRLGETDALLAEKHRRERWPRLIDGAGLGIVVCFLVFGVALLVMEPRRPEFRAFFLLEVAFLVTALGVGYVIQDHGWMTHGRSQFVIGTVVVIPILLTWLIHATFGARVPVWVRLACAGLALVAAGEYLDLPWATPGRGWPGTWRWHHGMFQLCLLLVLVRLTLVTWRAARGRRAGGRAAFAGILAILAPGLMLVVMTQVPIPRHAGFVAVLLLPNVFRVALGFTALLRFKEVSEGRILAAHGDERRRIARGLHDGVTQRLQALRLQAQLRSGDAGDALAAGIREAIDEVRGIARDLHPAGLSGHDLASAIRQHVAQLARAGSPARFDLDLGDNPPLSPATVEHLYRVVQEAIANALRHGRAQNVRIGLQAQGGNLRLAIADDGTGIPASETNRGGLGLTSIRERVGLLGGTLTVTTREEGGTELRVTVPAGA